MDQTLTQILSALIQAHAEIDRLRARVAELEREHVTQNGVVTAPAAEELVAT